MDKTLPSTTAGALVQIRLGTKIPCDAMQHGQNKKINTYFLKEKKSVD